MSDKAFAALIELRSSVIALESHPYSLVDHLTRGWWIESNFIGRFQIKCPRNIRGTIIKPIYQVFVETYWHILRILSPLAKHPNDLFLYIYNICTVVSFHDIQFLTEVCNFSWTFDWNLPHFSYEILQSRCLLIGISRVFTFAEHLNNLTHFLCRLSFVNSKWNKNQARRDRFSTSSWKFRGNLCIYLNERAPPRQSDFTFTEFLLTRNSRSR